MNIQNLRNAVTRPLSRGVLVAQKNGPAILTAVGVVGVVATAVLASKATLKLEETVDKIDEGLLAAKHRRAELSVDYSDRDYTKDVAYVYTVGTIDIIKLYGPAITTGVVAISCIIGAQGIMQKRNVAIVAAYKAVEEGFSQYRQRVVDELGEEKDVQFRYGLEDVTEHDTKKGKVTTKRVVANPDTVSVYAKFFDEYSTEWQRNAEINLFFLRCQQNYMNDLLRMRGHVFLNEVYDRLGIERTQAGQVVGWVLNGQGDSFIDFGIYRNDERARAFVHGIEPAILLDFNVDGVVLDLIKK